MRRQTILAVAIITFILVSLVSIPAMAAGGFVKYSLNPVVTGVLPWESGGVLAASVILDGSTYKMWYSGKDQDGFVRIGYATSPNGIVWAKDPGNPVLDVGGGGAWDSNVVGGPSVIMESPTSYKMWYTGADSSQIGQIGYATSTNGIAWTKYAGNPVMGVGASGSWEEFGVLNPSVIFDGSIYKMWYTGRDDDGSALGVLAIGYATSINGIFWTKYGLNPIMQKNLSGFDNRGVGGTYVIQEGPFSYTMYYTGFETGALLSEIGIATSSDGLNWNTRLKVLPVSAGWENKGVGDPSVLVTGNINQMWYTGTNDDFLPEIGYASETVPLVPASSNASTLAMIGGFGLLISLMVLLGRGRLQRQGR